MADGQAFSKVSHIGALPTEDDAEHEAFFRCGDEGTYKGGPSDSIAPVYSELAFELDLDEPDEAFFEQFEARQIRRERYQRRVAQLIAGLGVAVVGLLALRAMTTRDAAAASATPSSFVVAAAPVAVLPVADSVKEEPALPAEPAPMVLDAIELVVEAPAPSPPLPTSPTVAPPKVEMQAAAPRKPSSPRARPAASAAAPPKGPLGLGSLRSLQVVSAPATAIFPK